MPRRKRRVLIVNCYWPETRVAMQLPGEMPMPLAPVHLAGHFAPDRWEIRLYNEVANGHLEIFAPELLDWPEVVVFCGLTAAFDRFLHLSAYFRTRNPAIVTIAGGVAVRLLPTYAAAHFDYACRGDVEEIREVITEAFGADHVAHDPIPRYDLCDWMGHWIGYAESSRNCNFKCSFCTLTADALPWRGTDAALFERHLEAMGPRVLLHIADNQFAGAGRDAFAERLEVLKRARAKGLFRWWAGFVTDAFLWDEDNLRRAKESGCISLLIGVESFDADWLRRMNKVQNVRESQQALIRRCLDAGILFLYGLVFDPSERRVDEMERELDIIAADPTITAPAFIFAATPYPGTPFFADRFERGMILPSTKVRDLEGSTLNLRALDGEERAAEFLRTTKNLVGRRGRFLAHQLRFHWHYLQAFEPQVHLSAALTFGSITMPQALSNTKYLFRRRVERTHIGTTDILDPAYTPRHAVDPRYAHYFNPTMVTLADGSLNPVIADDLLRGQRRVAQAEVA